MVGMPFPRPLSIEMKMQGFTLIEVLVTISILSVLLTLAAPSLQGFFIKQKMRKISDDFTSSIFKAKNTAVNKNVCTLMCMSSSTAASAPSCDTKNGGDWQPGWIVFLNPSCDSSKDTPEASEDILEVRVGVNSEYYLQSQASTPTRKITFDSRGFITLANADRFDIVYKAVANEANDKYGMNICLDALGRTRTIPSSKTCDNYK